MPKKHAKKKHGRRIGKVRTIPKQARGYASAALAATRRAKAALEKSAPGARKAWGELHHVESRLSRLV